MSIMLGNPGGSPAGKEGLLLAFGSKAPKNGKGLGRPNSECTPVATDVGGGGGAMEVLKGWNGDSVEVGSPFLVGVK